MYDVRELVLEERPAAVCRQRLEVTEIGTWIGPAFGRVMQAVMAAGLRPTGMPFARYTRVPDTAAAFEVEAGFPVSAPLPEGAPGAPDDVVPSRLPGGPAAVVEHLGPYDAMTPAYEAVEKWIAERGGSPDGSPWECYYSEPTDDPSTWRTEIFQPYCTG